MPPFLKVTLAPGFILTWLPIEVLAQATTSPLGTPGSALPVNLVLVLWNLRVSPAGTVRLPSFKVTLAAEAADGRAAKAAIASAAIKAPISLVRIWITSFRCDSAPERFGAVLTTPRRLVVLFGLANRSRAAILPANH
jgi:hypothetical protein